MVQGKKENLEVVKNILERSGLGSGNIAEVLEDKNITRGDDLKETEMLLNVARREGALNGEKQ